MDTERNKRTGPKPERLKLRGDWQKLVGKALAKKPPAISSSTYCRVNPILSGKPYCVREILSKPGRIRISV
jgi:hypothetical protein